jgi:hypothetical protein
MLDYTIVYNILDYAAVTVPVAFADKDIDVASSYPAPLNDNDKKNWNACKINHMQSID